MELDLDKMVRENIRKMTPYSSARHEFTGTGNVFLDANENSFGSPLSAGGLNTAFNRYPDPLQWPLKEKISRIKGVPPANIFIGNGSDEAIDLLFRIFCEPGTDNIIICPPTYGMYQVCAEMNNVAVKKVSLKENWQLNMEALESAIDPFTKLIFICSPNNPTGNSISRTDIETILNNFDGLVVIDEAYINYSKQKSFIPDLVDYPNLVVLQTLSKAWGLAGLRIGMAFGSSLVINYMNKVKYPYNIGSASQQIALNALDNIETVNDWIQQIVSQRDLLKTELEKFPFTVKVYNSDANFLLVRMKEARKVYDYLAAAGIIVRDRSNVILCEDCLRITIGTPEENRLLISVLSEYNYNYGSKNK